MFDVSVIGCGARGQKHAEVWNNRYDARVVALCDTDEERLQKLADETGAAAYTDWQDAVLHEGVDIVSQCVPTNMHADVTCLAAENGRHIFGEKPLALTLEGGERIVETVQSNDVVFMPCFQRRDQDRYQKYRDFFQTGEFGGPVTFRYTMFLEVRPKTAMHSKSINVGVVNDMACHIFDLMRWMTDTEPERIYASGKVFGEGKERLAHIEDHAIDEASIELTVEGGHQLQLYLNWGMPEGFPNLGWDEWVVGPELAMQKQGPNMEVRYQDHTEVWPLDESAGHPRRIDKFARVVKGEMEPDLDEEDALLTLQLSHLALESIETGEACELTGTD